MDTAWIIRRQYLDVTYLTNEIISTINSKHFIIPVFNSLNNTAFIYKIFPSEELSRNTM